MRDVFAVEGLEGRAEGFEADPEATTLVAEDGAVAAGAVESAVGAAGDAVGAGAGDEQDARGIGEGCVEGDLFVAEEDEFTRDGCGESVGGPGADGGDGDSGEADAGAGDLRERDARGDGDLGEHHGETEGGFVLGDALEFDGAGGGAGDDSVGVGEEAAGGGASGVDGEVMRHSGHDMRTAKRRDSDLDR
jgi:hypothetical protein